MAGIITPYRPAPRVDPRWDNVYQQGMQQGLWDFDPQFDFQGHINEFVPNEVAGSPVKPKADVDWAGAVTGGLALAGNAIGMAQQGSGLQENAPGYQTSATGQPIYTGGAQYNQASSFSPQGATGGEVLGMAGQGAAAGASFGVPGAIVGGVVGAIGGLIGGGARKRKQQREKDKAMKSARFQQRQFNEADQEFDQKQAAQQDYYKRTNMNNRLYNLYGASQPNYF